ncbi:hypothetical protein ACNQGP_04040 [Flavobacterium sp. GT2N3]|uniref:hypothetical protein n=1 Tax=unclassified Flavobacterium TaxID=196869 RepID=UPI003AB0F917
MVWKNRNYDFPERHYNPYFLKKMNYSLLLNNLSEFTEFRHGIPRIPITSICVGIFIALVLGTENQTSF